MVIRLDYANPYTGNGWEFKCIAACAIGGVSLNGGRGNGLCIAIGVVSMMVLDNAIIMMGIDTNLQTTAIGAFLMIAASLDMIKQRKKIRAEALSTVDDTAAVAGVILFSCNFFCHANGRAPDALPFFIAR